MTNQNGFTKLSMNFWSMIKNKNEPFETIYSQHHLMVLQMCLGFVKGDKDTAKDLSQEIFISVWNNLEKFRGASSYKT